MLSGDTKTGISIIKISNELDAGDVIDKKTFEIGGDMYSDELMIALTNLGKKSMIEILPDIFDKKIILENQNEKKATYAKKFITDDRKINFNNSTVKVYNHIRAHGPNPGSWFVYRGERIKILKAIIKNDSGEESTILNKYFMLACNDGSILPTIIQREGKKAVTIDEFIKGFSFTVNDKLNV